MFAFASVAALNNPLVFQAASTVAKKAFEAVAARSLKGITEIISERFKGDAEVLRLRDELELKVRVLSLPIDICVQHAVRGNSALQGALDVALKALRDIEEFEEGLREQDITAGRGEASTPDAASIRAAARKLEALIKQLDSLLPYLGVAISAVGLVDTGDQQLSPSRLMAASWHIRSSAGRPSAPIFHIPQAKWHKEGLAAAHTATRPMQEQLPLCSVCIRRSPAGERPWSAAAAVVADATADSAASGASFAYELFVKQDLEDGMHHEKDEAPAQLLLPIQDILAIDWSTSQSLKLGDADFRPALLLQVLQPPGTTSQAPSRRAQPAGDVAAENGGALRPHRDAESGSNSPAASSSTAPKRASSRLGKSTPQASATSSDASAVVPITPSTPATPAHGRVTRYAIQCAALPDAEPAEPGSSAEWQTLSEFEYVLRLCMLEAREELPLSRIGDERIRMAFSATPGAAVASGAQGGRAASLRLDQRSPSGRGSHEIEHLSRDLDRLGFGSPV
ncbi:hypothetical protein WJX72_005880 [[Myrmecia] bisecta]|uniref:Uncharacterized protein n=1 Tax=[Myrmecia] bisecta TaxID=41462 RepID=A0AAW1PT67_9CHLO